MPDATALRDAIQRDPTNARLHNSLGIALAQQGQPAVAEASFRRALELQPDHAKAFNNLGNVLSEQGRLPDALTAYQQAVRFGYREAAVQDNLGITLLRLGDPRAAEFHFQKALKATPDDPERLKRVGMALTTLIQFEAAIAAFRKALRVKADDADTHWRLGEALHGAGSLDAAIASFAEAVRLRPDHAPYLHHLGAAHMQRGDLDESLVYLRRGRELDPTDAALHSSLLFCLCYHPGVSPKEVLAEHRRWAEQHAAYPQPTSHPNDRTRDRRLRIGYVSPDFRGHPVGRFVEPLLTRHDPAKVDVFCYDEYARPADPLTARLQAKVPNWRNVRGLSDEKLVELIRADKIDILVDLAGHTASHRLGAFARKPAPVQVTYLGFPNTTGIPAIDYLLTDVVADPPGEKLLTETPVHLPGGFCCFQPRQDVPGVVELPALAAKRVTFGCLHNQAKLNAKVFDLWAAVLKVVPTSRLLFARHTMAGEIRERIARAFRDRGIAPDRLLFRQLAAGSSEYWTVYKDIDVHLDPFPWTGHTTACESLWMGVPSITLRGQAHAGRMVASVMTHAGLPEWVAETPEDYVRIATQWANDLPKLAALRAGMRERLQRSTLCDPTSFARRVEEAFRGMWHRYCDKPVTWPGLSPSPLVGEGRGGGLHGGSVASGPQSSTPHPNPPPQGGRGQETARRAIDLLARAEQRRLAGDWTEAEKLFRQLLDADPQHVEAWTAFGDACKTLGKWTDAVKHYRRALDLRPQVPRTWNSLGIAFANQRLYDDAAQAFGQVVTLDPDHAKGWNNFANTLAELARFDDAIGAYRAAIRLGYEDAALHENLANLLFRQGQYADAEASYRELAKYRPDDPMPVKKRAEVLAKLGQLDAGIELLRQLTERHPKDAEGHWRYGNALAERGDLHKAAEAYHKALAEKPNHAPYLHHLATARMMAGRIAEGTSYYRQAMAAMPNNRLSHASLLFVMCYDPDLAPADVFAEHQRWGQLYGQAPGPIAAHPNDRSPSRPLRVGYVSPDFRGHPVGRFIEPFLTRHDPARIEVFCYDEFLRQPDPLMGRLQAKVSNWRNIRGVADDKVCEMIRTDRIDILVDLAGHTASNRLGVFARKPAPVQVTYLGYPNTTGIPNIDYLLTDSVVDPPNQPVLLTETPYPLPNGFCVFHGRTDVPEVLALPALAAGRLTFGCFHNQAKLNGKVLDLWARVLQAVPAARMLFARHTLTDESKADLLGQFAQRGIPAERILVRQLRAGGFDHWQVYHDVDVSLDPFPWTGHTTSCESLWMGVPTITLRGKAHAGRMVASVLTHAGLPEWIAETPEQYVQLAVKWASDIPKLAALRAGLREKVRRSKLCDAEAFTRHLENAFRDMWRKWCAGAR